MTCQPIMHTMPIVMRKYNQHINNLAYLFSTSGHEIMQLMLVLSTHKSAWPALLHVCSIGVPESSEGDMGSCTLGCIEGATMTARVVYSIQTKLSKSRIILTTYGDRHHRILEKHWCSRYTTSLLNLLLCIPNDQARNTHISFVRRGNRAICHG